VGVGITQHPEHDAPDVRRREQPIPTDGPPRPDPLRSVDDLVNAIHAQTAYVSSSPRPITVAGYTGRQIDVQVPTSVDPTTCTSNGGDPGVPSGTGGH
jgi:hypothetical protein